jgi:O-antigen/teichoic acid export membrane protein
MIETRADALARESTSTEETTGASSLVEATAERTASAIDARDLRRGALVNLVGYAARALHPVLLAWVTVTYGPERWGVFVASNAVLWVALRFAVLGLDHALPWWIPQHGDRAVPGVFAALRQIAWRATVLAIVLASLAAPVLGPAWGMPALPIAVLALCLVPMALTEALVQATVARRHLELQVGVREVLVPAVHAFVALGLHAFGLVELGLALGFFVASCVGLAVTAIGFRRVFPPGALVRDRGLSLPPALRRQATPLFGAGLATTFMARADTLAVAFFADPFSVGVYGVVKQFSSTVLSIRGSFESIVTAIVSDAALGGRRVEAARARLARGLSYATTLVTLTQLPVVVFFVAFAGWLLPLFGEGFERGERAVAIACGLLAVHGLVGLAGQVVNGVGGSRATLVASVFAVALQSALLLGLVPRFGIEGAAAASGLALVGHAAVQLVQMRALTGGWNYTPRVAFAGALGGIAIAAMTITTLALHGVGDFVARASAFVVFAGVLALGAFPLLASEPASRVRLGARWTRQAAASEENRS